MLTVQITNGNKKETITVVPDAFFVVHFQVQGKQVYMPFFFELDRGTEGVKQFKRKIEGLLTAVYSK
jgi:hypothetical protein